MNARETHRHATALAVTWAGVATALGMFVYETEAYNPNAGHFAPPWVSFAFIAAAAVAIIGANVAGRLKMTDAVLRAFEIGFKSAEKQFHDMKERE